MNLVRTKLHIPTSLITPFNYREYIFVLQGLCDFEILGLFLWDFEWFLGKSTFQIIRYGQMLNIQMKRGTTSCSRKK